MTPSVSPSSGRNRTSEAVEMKLVLLRKGFMRSYAVRNQWFDNMIQDFPAIAEKYKRMEENLAIACDLLDVARLHTDANGLRKALSFDPLSNAQ